ncbi:MAG: pseudaminic acid cytidylyltransferase, partial [Bacteroidetes bacterium]|nr:pseudaminic acid cytidylyltransferase [Bacteroidota bacterium]
EFLGKPIIAYSIEAAIKSNLFDEIIVSTDDEEIAKIARQYGAKVPFFRSNRNSDDFAGLEDVILEALNFYKAKTVNFDNICCILATAPFITIDKLKQCLSKLNKGFSSVFPVLRYSYPIQRSLKNVDGKIELVYPEYIDSRSQDLEPRFHDSGQFYWMKVDKFYDNKELFTDNTSYIELEEIEVQDIDTSVDWKIAEFKYRYFKITKGS